MSSGLRNIAIDQSRCGLQNAADKTGRIEHMLLQSLVMKNRTLYMYIRPARNSCSRDLIVLFIVHVCPWPMRS